MKYLNIIIIASILICSCTKRDENSETEANYIFEAGNEDFREYLTGFLNPKYPLWINQEYKDLSIKKLKQLPQGSIYTSSKKIKKILGNDLDYFICTYKLAFSKEVVGLIYHVSGANPVNYQFILALHNSNGEVLDVLTIGGEFDEMYLLSGVIDNKLDITVYDSLYDYSNGMIDMKFRDSSQYTFNGNDLTFGDNLH
ncbi:hypothetical protein [Persicobacter diffluens]|uniref:Lipoprotein n=1 Tax=Persicobacter diffluens TaxID=981 RepID=A0AAN5AMW5_9BACT|nr:hypothetical protein PEDI_54060 [Persicobacter diffluens]